MQRKRQTRTPFQTLAHTAALLVANVSVASGAALTLKPGTKFGELTGPFCNGKRLRRSWVSLTAERTCLHEENSITPTADRREIPLLLQDPNGWPLLFVMHRPLFSNSTGKRDFPPAPPATNHRWARRASRVVIGDNSAKFSPVWSVAVPVTRRAAPSNRGVS